MHNKSPFVLLLFVTACSTLPERDVTVTTPKTWAASDKADKKIVNHWLTEFSDSHLTALVNEALTHNYDLKAASNRIQVAKEQAVIEGAPRLPQVNLMTDYQRSWNVRDRKFSLFSALFNVTWEIDVWGRIRNAQQAQEQEAVATEADYQAAKLSLAARTAQTYFDLVEANLQVQVAAQSVKDRRTIAELVQGRFTRGLTGGLDLRLVLTDVANAEAQLATARNQVQMITRRLEVLLGRYPKAELQQSAKLPMPPKTLAAGLPSELLKRRPDLNAALKRLQSADSRLASSEQALLPRITLTASGGSSSPDLTELIDPRAAAWHLLAGLMQPIFTGDRLEANVRLNQAKVEEAVNLYHSTALNAFQEVEQALAAEQWLREQEKALQEAVKQTEASQKLAVYSYSQGLIQILTLLDSYRSTFTAQSDYLIVQRQLLNNRINLYLALGGSV